VTIDGFSPKNFNKRFSGVVHADEALSRSINVSALLMLREYGLAPFYHILKKVGITTLDKNFSHYGLSLILGGAEVTPWDIAGVYSSMARILKTHNETGWFGDTDYSFLPPSYLPERKLKKSYSPHARPIFNPAAIWLTFEAMKNVERPESEGHWKYFSSSGKVAWKTGTSFGFRDAWSVGTTPKYTVVVWVGNADGEGRPELIGTRAAAPIMFEIFDVLPRENKWFEKPEGEMVEIEVCSISGYRATERCEKKERVYVMAQGIKTKPCPFHTLIHLDQKGEYRVHGGCESPYKMKPVNWFILPPIEEWHYRLNNLTYQPPPQYRKDCLASLPENKKGMDLLSPHENAKIYVPIELNETKGKVIFEAVHRVRQKTIYWHIDNEYIGSTKDFHQIAVSPSFGNHSLTIVDEDGLSIKRKFTILGKLHHQ
ncbi:MAG: penicillin-binding protein 1C, partial [Nitrospinae bacterium]|nr:penicillin-binding protein 1C [Nitrospinota bacterium]